MSASTAIANSAISTLYRILVYLFLQVVSPPLLSPAPLSPPHHAATLRAATPLLTGLVTIQEEKVVVQEEHKSDKNGEVVTDVSISETTIVALSPEPLNVSLVLRLHAYRSSS